MYAKGINNHRNNITEHSYQGDMVILYYNVWINGKKLTSLLYAKFIAIQRETDSITDLESGDCSSGKHTQLKRLPFTLQLGDMCCRRKPGWMFFGWMPDD